MEFIDQNKQSWWQMLSIQAGGALCLPVIMVGYLVCQNHGWLTALTAVGIGNLFLMVMGYTLATLSSSSPKSTVEHAIDSFGKKGSVLFTSLMILSMMGWFGIQLNVMTLCLKKVFQLVNIDFDFLLTTWILGGLMSSIMCFGMRSMKVFSNMMVPILGLILLFKVWTLDVNFSAHSSGSSDWIIGLSLVIGVNIVAVIDLPTFFQHARSKRDTTLCIVLLYGLVVPLVQFVGIYLAASKQGSFIIETLQEGYGTLWLIVMSFFIFVSGWMTNNANLYSAIVSSKTFSIPAHFVTRTLIIGLTGTFIASLNPLEHLESLLNGLGMVISSMGAVMISNQLVRKKITIPSLSFAAWLLGVGTGLCSIFFSSSITGVATFDAFLVPFASILICKLLISQRKLNEAISS